jgi:nicotinamidase-related amidase
MGTDGGPSARPRIGFGERPALLIIDMQRDFIDEDAPATCAPMARERLPAVQRLLELGRTAGIPIFFSQGLVSPDLSDVGHWKGAHGSGAVQIEGTPGADIVDELRPQAGEKVIRKRRPSAFFATDLEVFLRGLGIDTLLLAGSSMSGCVRATAVDAFSRDYRTIVVRDCVIDRKVEVMEASLYDMDAKYADVVDLVEVRDYLEHIGGPTT